MTFSYHSEFISDILADALRERGWSVRSLDSSAEPDAVALLLETAGADIVLSSPLEYARAVGIIDYALVPGVAITTRGLAGLIRLLFIQGREDIQRVVIRRGHPYETLACNMVLTEKYDIEPSFIEVDPDMSVDQMLALGDALLLTGDDAILGVGERRSFLDISDEWEDLFEEGLPYRIAWGPMGSVDQRMIDMLIEARNAAVARLVDPPHPGNPDLRASTLHKAFRRSDISFELGDEEIRGLETFFRYAYYHGAIPDIPAIKFLSDRTAERAGNDQ